MSHRVEITESEPSYIAVVRSKVQPSELAHFIPSACGEVWAFAKAAGLLTPGRNVAVYLEDLEHVEAGAEVWEPFIGNDRVHCSKLPSGRVVTTTHYGPYQRLSEAHGAINEWCGQHGHRLTGLCWEIYGHWEEHWTLDPSKIRTDVFYQLE